MSPPNTLLFFFTSVVILKFLILFSTSSFWASGTDAPDAPSSITNASEFPTLVSICSFGVVSSSFLSISQFVALNVEELKNPPDTKAPFLVSVTVVTPS